MQQSLRSFVRARLLGWVYGIGLLMALLPQMAQAQAGPPFTCDVVFYQMRNLAAGDASLLIKFAAVSPTVTPTSVFTTTKTEEINAIGYNPVDNYIYGIRSNGTTAQLHDLYRIGQLGYELVGTITNPLAGGAIIDDSFVPTSGAFDAAGRYYFAGQGGGNIVPGAIFRMDNVLTTAISHQYNIATTQVNFGDFDFNGAGGPSGLLLAGTGTPTGVLSRIQLAPNNTNPAAGTATFTNLTIGALGGIGSAFYDAATSKFYVFDNNENTFREIVNAQAGVPSVVTTAAAAYTGPPVFAGPFSPTDGSSCPISGQRRADVSITKTNNSNTVTTGGVTAYTIVVTNNGPYPANYSVVRDPPAVGLQKLSVTCSTPPGFPAAVCPATLSTSTLEAGVPIITFPPDTSLSFTVNALVTATTASVSVSNQASVSVAIDTIDSNLTNNSATDTDPIASSVTNVVSAASICPASTVETLPNLISNSDFLAATPLGSQAVVGAVDSFGVANFIARQQGQRAPTTGGGFTLLQNPFPGDATRSVANSNNWLLSNGKSAAGNYAVWQQPVTGLTVGKTYQFMYYISNATTPGTNATVTAPTFQPQLVTPTGTLALGAPDTFANETAGTADRWTLVQRSFVATSTTHTVTIANFNATSGAAETGDIAAIAQPTLRACEPAANVRVSKTNGVNSLISNGTTAYTITVSNPTAITANTTLITDPAVSNLIKTSVTCVVSGTSLCPTPISSITVLALEGAGLVIPRISPNSTVTFQIAATASGAPGSTATNFVTVVGQGYSDPDLSDNQAQDADGIVGLASLSITKTDSVTAVKAGGTTSYTITIALTGVTTVVGAIFKDPTVSGLSCNAVTCTGTIGAATCPAPAQVTIANMTGPGIVLPSMGPPSSISFRVDCNVTATGF
jgi:uncharacterized repeat protein (TIGR01451 family)